MIGDTRDVKAFLAYLEACTDAQLLGVIDKETKAGRHGEAALAQIMLIAREKHR